MTDDIKVLLYFLFFIIFFGLIGIVFRYFNLYFFGKYLDKIKEKFFK